MSTDRFTQISTDKKGQAILELAIFGAILIYLLGILVSYGLKYNFQQRQMQQVFRKALGAVSSERSASYAIVKDQHIPNPANPFAVGELSPVIVSASVTRNPYMHESANDASSLPKVHIEVDTKKYSYKTAAFRKEYNVSESDLDDEYKDKMSKYSYIYGGEGTGWWELSDGDCLTWDTQEVANNSPNASGPVIQDVCTSQGKNIQIIDGCAGEIISYDTCVTQCKDIVAAGIYKPWYCEGTNLQQLVATSASQSMGLQSGYSRKNTVSNTLSKAETSSTITTTDTLNWKTDTSREIIYNDSVDSSGFYETGIKVKTQAVDTTVSQNKTTQWQTAF